MAEVTLDRIQGVMSRQNDSCVVSSNPKKTKWWWHGGKRLACWFVYVTRNAYISSGKVILIDIQVMAVHRGIGVTRGVGYVYFSIPCPGSDQAGR